MVATFFDIYEDVSSEHPLCVKFNCSLPVDDIMKVKKVLKKGPFDVKLESEQIY
jgi:hypothetical protein